MISVDKNALIWFLQNINKSHRVSFSNGFIQTMFDGDFIQFKIIEEAYDRYCEKQQSLVKSIGMEE